MISPAQSIRAAIGNVGAEIYAELSSTSWANPTMASIRELGIAVGSHPGYQRARNEDRAVVAHVTSQSNECFRVAIVCDGVGGSDMGDTAATLAVAAFIGELARVRDWLPLDRRVAALIRKADEVVRDECRGRGATTLSVVVASRTEWAAANIGDSRIFSWSAGAGTFEQVSVDDTLENEMRVLKVMDQSVLDAKGLRGHLSQAIGEDGRTSEDLRVNTYGRERLTTGAILATDGAWKGQESGFMSIAMHAPSANDAMRRLLAFATWTGGRDNVSVIAIDDLKTFSPECGTGGASTAESRVSLWIGDSRVTICGVAGFEADSFHERASAKPKGQKPRRSKRSLREGETGKGQIDFREADRDPVARPHIEISIDENPT